MTYFSTKTSLSGLLIAGFSLFTLSAPAQALPVCNGMYSTYIGTTKFCYVHKNNSCDRPPYIGDLTDNNEYVTFVPCPTITTGDSNMSGGGSTGGNPRNPSLGGPMGGTGGTGGGGMGGPGGAGGIGGIGGGGTVTVTTTVGTPELPMGGSEGGSGCMAIIPGMMPTEC